MTPTGIFRAWLRAKAPFSSQAATLYKRLFRPSGEDWAEALRESGRFERMGTGCSIQANVTITNPELVALGNNVRLTGCTLFGHDGSVNMINRAYGLKLDSVGPIVIGNDVFIGHGATVLPGVTIGSRVIVAAGAVVTRDIPDNSLAAGVPARVVKSLDEYVERLIEKNNTYPWRSIIERRAGAYDPKLEGTLTELRRQHFFAPRPTSAEPRLLDGGSQDEPASPRRFRPRPGAT